MHPTPPHDCLPTLAKGSEAGAILYTEGDDLYAAMIATIEELLREDAADVLQHECIAIA
jgi:hypothetical protein